VLLPDLLAQSARATPEKWAAISPDERVTFSDLDRKSSQVAARLRRLGVGPGHRAALVFENSVAALVYFWGVLKTGAAAVDISSQAAPSVIRDTLRDCAPRALAVSSQVLKRLLSGACPSALPPLLLSAGKSELFGDAAGTEIHSLEEICQAEEPTPSRPSVGGHDVALIVYTSGTTGRPKGVMLSHQNLLSNILSVNSRVGLTSEHSVLIVVPFNFIHGRFQILTHAHTGGTLFISSGFQFPTVVLEEMVKYQVSGLSGVPYHFRALLERTPLSKTPLPHLKYVVVTGGALSPAALLALQAALPDVDIHIAYGQTEASPRIANLDPKDLLRKVGCVGRAVPGLRIDILDDDGSSLPPGATGEVVVTGPNVMTGYVSGDERSLGTIDDQGRLHTGDLGWMDSHGDLYLAGRKSEMIKTAGERIFPKEIEDVLNAHPAVEDSAVIGVKDEELGERIIAFVALRGSHALSLSEVRQHCLRSMPFIRIPREIRPLARIPKTQSGKIHRSELFSLYQEERDRR
jgi:acyl-CoA synthetase (AMP-forming)/AMP-acid ligase II